MEESWQQIAPRTRHVFFFKQQTAYEVGLGIPAEPLFRSVLATDNNTVGMGAAGIKSAIQGSNVPTPDEAVPSFVSGAMAKAGKGLLEGTLQAGTSAVSDKLLDLVGLGGKSAADKGKDTRDYLAAAFPELNAWERAGADASSAGMVDAGFENQKELTKMQLDNQKEIAEMQNE